MAAAPPKGVYLGLIAPVRIQKAKLSWRLFQCIGCPQAPDECIQIRIVELACPSRHLRETPHEAPGIIPASERAGAVVLRVIERRMMMRLKPVRVSSAFITSLDRRPLTHRELRQIAWAHAESLKSRWPECQIVAFQLRKLNICRLSTKKMSEKLFRLRADAPIGADRQLPGTDANWQTRPSAVGRERPLYGGKI